MCYVFEWGVRSRCFKFKRSTGRGFKRAIGGEQSERKDRSHRLDSGKLAARGVFGATDGWTVREV